LAASMTQPLRLHRDYTSGSKIVTGVQGPSGSVGFCGSTDTSSDFYSPQLSTDSIKKPTEDEDEATAKMSTLRSLLYSYERKLESLKGIIRKLEDEKRRLTLVKNNIEDDRIFKLDLSKLSAFGFEDIN